MEVQTRNQNGALEFFSTFGEALDHSKVDTTVWKISFDLPTGEQIRLVKNDEGKFEYEPIL